MKNQMKCSRYYSSEYCSNGESSLYNGAWRITWLLKRLWIGISVFLLVGCGPTIPPPVWIQPGTEIAFNDDDDRGIVVGTVTRAFDNKCFREWAVSYKYVNLSTNDIGHIGVVYTDLKDFEDVKGTKGSAFAILLPVGEYTITGDYGLNREAARFNVQKSTITYIGDFNARIRCALTPMLLREYVKSRRNSVRNKLERDYPFLLKKFSFIQDNKLVSKFSSGPSPSAIQSKYAKATARWERWSQKDRFFVETILGGSPTPDIPQNGCFKTLTPEESNCSEMARTFDTYSSFCKLRYELQQANQASTEVKYIFPAPEDSCEKAEEARKALSLMYDCEVVGVTVTEGGMKEFSPSGPDGTWTEQDMRDIVESLQHLPTSCN